MSPEELEAYLREHIPLSRALGVRAIHDSEGRIVLEAPLEPNVNHRATAFGGSVSAVAILAGWAAVHVRLAAEAIEAHTVIQRSAVEFEAPISGTFRAVADPIGDEAWRRLMRALTRRGRGRVYVDVRVEAAARRVATVRGAYVALAG